MWIPGADRSSNGNAAARDYFSFGGGIKGGKKFKAALLGGAAGVFLSEKLLDVPMDFENLKENKAVLGSGGHPGDERGYLDRRHALSIAKFFAHESCGQCAPCRIGTRQLVDLAYRIRSGRGRAATWKPCSIWPKRWVHSSLCPLGQSLVMPVKSALGNFREEFAANLK